jgi:hypothetical protein
MGNSTPVGLSVSGDCSVGYLKCRRAVCVRRLFIWVIELLEGCLCQGIV